MLDFESLGHEPEGSGGRGCLRVTLITINFSFYKRNWSLGKGSSWVIWFLVLTLRWHQKPRKSGWRTVASQRLQFHGTGVGTLALLTNAQKADASVVLGIHFEGHVNQGHRSGRRRMPSCSWGEDSWAECTLKSQYSYRSHGWHTWDISFWSSILWQPTPMLALRKTLSVLPSTQFTRNNKNLLTVKDKYYSH